MDIWTNWLQVVTATTDVFTKHRARRTRQRRWLHKAIRSIFKFSVTEGGPVVTKVGPAEVLKW